MLISKAYKEAYDTETDNSETEDNKKQEEGKEGKEGHPEKKRRKEGGEEEAGPTYDLTSLRDDKQLNLFFEEKYHRHWMGQCRPIPLMKTNKALLSAKSMLGSRENFDPLPDIPLDYETKELSVVEHSTMMSYKCNLRTRNLSPEDQYYNPHWVQPDLNLMVEMPILIENNWRKRF